MKNTGILADDDDVDDFLDDSETYMDSATKKSGKAQLNLKPETTTAKNAQNENESSSDDEFGLKDDPAIKKLDLGTKNKTKSVATKAPVANKASKQVDNDDCDFFSDDDDDKPQKKKAATKPEANDTTKSETSNLSGLPELPISQLSKEVKDFKGMMKLSVDEQKKKNQINDQIIAERPDESESDSDCEK